MGSINLPDQDRTLEFVNYDTIFKEESPIPDDLPPLPDYPPPWPIVPPEYDYQDNQALYSTFDLMLNDVHTSEKHYNMIRREIAFMSKEMNRLDRIILHQHREIERLEDERDKFMKMCGCL